MTPCYRKVYNPIIVYNPFVKKDKKVKVQLIKDDFTVVAEVYLEGTYFDGPYRRLNSAIRIAFKGQHGLIVPSNWTYLNEYPKERI